MRGCLKKIIRSPQTYHSSEHQHNYGENTNMADAGDAEDV